MPHPYPETALRQLRRHEGFSPTVYLCTAGARTIGYGTNIDANPVPGITDDSVINREQAERLMVAELLRLEAELHERAPWVALLDTVRHATLLNMAYNMGVGGLLGFKRAMAACRSGDYAESARQMLDSKWAGQVHHRAIDLANQMQTGLWCPEDVS